MSLRARLAAVGAATVLGEGALGATVLVTAGPVRMALYLIVCAVVTAILLAVVWRLLGDSGDDDDGGGGGPGDDPPPPPWWPQFERDFRRYVHERERATRLG